MITKRDLSVASVSLLLAGMTCCYNAKAETYLTAGFGQSKTCHNGLDGCWMQSPWQSQIDELSNAWQVGFGKTELFGLKWLTGEVRYSDLGEYNIFAAYAPSDKKFDPEQQDGCIGDCPPTRYAYGHVNVKALSFSLLPEYDLGELAIYARVGVSRVKAKYEVLYSAGKPYEQELRSYDSKRYMLWEPHYGLGVRIKGFTIDYTMISPLKPEDSCLSKNKTVTVSYRWAI